MALAITELSGIWLCTYAKTVENDNKSTPELAHVENPFHFPYIYNHLLLEESKRFDVSSSLLLFYED